MLTKKRTLSAIHRMNVTTVHAFSVFPVNLIVNNLVRKIKIFSLYCQNLITFVVRIYLKKYDVRLTRALNQETGGTYGCKSRSLFELQFRCVRGDPSLFHNQNIFKMRTQTDECSTALIPAEKATNLINTLLVVDDPTLLRQHLRAMADSYLLSEDENRYRHDVYSSYMALDNLLEKIEIELRKERRAA